MEKVEKYIECHNCQKQYDCERTYLGGCTDGKEWEEKKLADDTEIDVGMIEKSVELDKDIMVWLIKGSIWKDYSLSKILDLIHRLQREKAEYERKLADGELVSKEWHDEQMLYWQDRYKEQSEETDELKAYRDKIEQGTLIKLPCKVGDTVYIGYGASGIAEWEVREIVIVKNDILFRLTHEGTEDYNAAWLSEAGTYLFFTREEAEVRLKEIQK